MKYREFTPTEISLANALRLSRVLNSQQWSEDCKVVAWSLSQSDKRFDRLKFLDMCGVA